MQSKAKALIEVPPTDVSKVYVTPPLAREFRDTFCKCNRHNFSTNASLRGLTTERHLTMS